CSFNRFSFIHDCFDRVIFCFLIHRQIISHDGLLMLSVVITLHQMDIFICLSTGHYHLLVTYLNLIIKIKLTKKVTYIIIFEYMVMLCIDYAFVYSEGGKFMTKTNVKKNEPIEDALRRFKRNGTKNGTIQEARKREFYEKPSVKRKKKSEAAR